MYLVMACSISVTLLIIVSETPIFSGFLYAFSTSSFANSFAIVCVYALQIIKATHSLLVRLITVFPIELGKDCVE